jgi:glutathione S-transferase
MTTPVLYIGNKNYSSWSMRPWLALRWAGIAFEERVIPLGGVGYGKSQIPEVLAASPSGRVPALHADGVVIWDSLAICEWAHERAPHAGLWPENATARAVARSAACEMHSSYAALRRDLPINIRRRTSPKAWPVETMADIARVQDLWADVRDRFGAGGPFLFGARSIADAMFAPVVTRFVTYGVALSPVSQAYVEAVQADPEMQAWSAAAAAEAWTIPSADAV